MRVLPSPVRISAILPWWSTTRAHQLDVVLAHAHRPLHGLAAGGEDLGDHVVQGLLQALVLALAACLGQVAAALEVGALELVLGRLLGLGGLEEIGPDDVDPLADLVVGQGLVLGLELVGPVDEGWIRASSRSLLSKNRERKRIAG